MGLFGLSLQNWSVKFCSTPGALNPYHLSALVLTSTEQVVITIGLGVACKGGLM